MSYREILRPILKRDEAERGDAYDDATGKRVRAPIGNLTIGIGHNLDAKPLSAAAQAFILDEDIDDAEALARTLVPAFDDLDYVRQSVICSMTFNLGDKFSEFRFALAAIHKGLWGDAARAMLDSEWAKQVGDRAKRLAEMMRTGNMP